MNVADALATSKLAGSEPVDRLPSSTGSSGSPDLDLAVLRRSSDVVANVKILIRRVGAEREIGRRDERGAIDGNKKSRVVGQEKLQVESGDTQHGRWATFLPVRDA